MTKCGWNECRDGVVKRCTELYAPGCPECMERRAMYQARYRARLRGESVVESEEKDNHEYSELGDYILRRDAAGNLLPPEPKPGRPAFVEVELSEQ